MICVTLGRTRHRMMVAEHQALAEAGAQLVELRLDWLNRMPDLNRLINERPTPIVLTIRRPADGGRWRGAEDQRLMLLRQAIVAGVEFVDLEEDIAGKVPRFGKTRRIVSYHNFQETPENLDEIYARMAKLDPDVVKIVTMARSPRDNVRLLRLSARTELPTIAFCMGEFGVPSRILCGKYGAPFTYATFSKDRVMAPGQLSFQEMRDLYHYDAIDAQTRAFAVIGDPLAHSYSPLLHNATFRHEKLNCVYIPIRIPAEELTETLNDFAALDIRGYSVTIPHKEAIAAWADHPDEAVKQIGAGNTLYRDERGRWYAYNTDYEAAMETLRLGLSEGGFEDIQLAGKRVLMLGAGGVAKAIGLGLMRAEVALTIASRNKKRSKALAEQLGCQFVNWENRGSVFADILVNCTPVGMFPDVDDSPFAENWMRDGMLVFDTIYNPENTLLLKQARARNCKVASGLEMFVRQAAAQYECFVKQSAPLDVMRATLRKGISPVRLN